MLFRPRLLLCSMLVSGTAAAAAPAPMTLDQYLALSGPKPSATFSYGTAPSQFAQLFRPAGAGPFPVVVLVHGGCWTVQYGGITQMHAMAGALAARGIAVWNVEYRRADEAGGGYPGTYLDMHAALEKLESEAPRQQLDLKRIVAVGHSAGGQLVQWMAGRSKIAPGSPLFRANPLPLPTIVSLGGLADLRREQALIKQSCDCDVVKLAGVASAQRPDIFSDTNAADLIPNGSRTVLITGALDTISPPRAAYAYAARAQAAGDRAEVIILPGASHYDEVAPSSPAWRLILPVIEQALDMPGASR